MSEKNKGGRPTKFNDKVIEKSLDYLENFHKHDDLIPSAASLCLILNVNRSTLYEWASKHESFSDILAKINMAQEKVLLRGGLSGDFNSTIAKLVLAKQGYKDSSDVDIMSGGEKLGVDVNFVKTNKK